MKGVGYDSRLMSISFQLKNIKILAGFRLFLFLLERVCSLSTFVSLLSSSSGTRFNVNYAESVFQVVTSMQLVIYYLTSKLPSSREFSLTIIWFVVYTCFVLFVCFGVRREVVACWTPCLIGSLTTKLFKLNCYSIVPVFLLRFQLLYYQYRLSASSSSIKFGYFLLI